MPTIAALCACLLTLRRPLRAACLAGTATLILLTFAIPQTAAAAEDLPAAEKNRRTVYSGLFAMAANLNGPLPGGSADASTRIPASSFSLIGAALAQAYEDAPWLDPNDAAAVLGTALKQTGCASPCVPPEQSATQMLRRAEEVVRDPGFVSPAQRDVAFVYANAIAEVGSELGREAKADPLKLPILALPPERVGQRVAECAADSPACGDATDKLFAGYLQGTSVDATPAQLNQTAVVKGAKLTVPIGDAVPMDDGIVEGETIEFKLSPLPVKLAGDGSLQLNPGAVEPPVTPLEQVPEGSAERLRELLAKERGCQLGGGSCVPPAELDEAHEKALQDWFERAIKLATPDPAEPGKKVVIADALGWLRALTLWAGDDRQGPLWDGFRDEAERVEAAIIAAVDAEADTAHQRCTNGEPAQVVALLQAERSRQLLGGAEDSARLEECMTKVDTQEEVAKAAAAAQLNATNTVTVQADAGLDSLAAGVTGERRQAKNAAFWKAGEDERKAVLASVASLNKTLDQSQALAGMVGDLVAVTNPALGKQIKVVAKASVAIAKAATGAVSGIVQLGSQIATGNFIGAAMSSITLIQDMAKAAGLINGLFLGDTAEPEKTPDEILSDQIAQLTTQVEDLGKTMNQRFDVVDKKLNAIYTTMAGGFRTLAEEIDQIGRKVDLIGDTVRRIEGKLDQFERNMYQLAREGLEGNLLTAVNEGIGSGKVMGWEAFNRVSSVLYTHATHDARQSAALDNLGWRTADEPVAERLAGIAGDDGPYSLEANVNYLGWLAAKGTADGQPALGSFGTWGNHLPHLPNLGHWALASKAYARMVMEQPAAAGSSEQIGIRLQDLEKIGLDLKREIAELSTDGALFDELLQLHGLRAGRLLGELDKARKAWLEAKKLDVDTLYGGPGRGVPIDENVLGGDEKVLGSRCELVLSRPSSLPLDAMFARPQYSLAQRLGGEAGEVRLCAGAGWVGQHQCGWGIPKPQCAQLHVSFTSEYRAPGGEWKTLRRAGWTSETESTVCSGPVGEFECTEAALVAAALWERSLKADFTPTFADEPADVESTHRLALDGVRARLDTVQKELATAMHGEVGAGPASSVRGAADRLTDAKALIRAFAALGFPMATAQDEKLRLLLFGDEAVLDRGLVFGELAGSNWRRDVDPLATLRAWHESHSKALGEVIDAYQLRIQQGRHSETHQLIEVTLEDLRVAKRVAAPLSIAANGTRVGATLLGGETASTGDAIGAADPVSARITLPKRGAVLLTERPAGGSVGRQVEVKAPVASAEEPLVLEFRIDAARLGSGGTLRPVRDGVPVADCVRPGVTAPDPCVAARDVLADGDVRLRVLTSRGSTWAFEQAGAQPPSCQETGTCPPPSCNDTGTCPPPSCEATGTCPPPSCEASGTCPPPSCQTTGTCQPPSCEATGTCPPPSCEATGTCPDTKPPTASLSVRPQKLSAVRSKGLALAVKANEAGTAKAELLLDKRTAKQLGLRAGVLARGSATLASAGTAKVVVTLTGKAKAKLARARTVKFTVRVVFTDRAGNNSAPATKRLLLRR